MKKKGGIHTISTAVKGRFLFPLNTVSASTPELPQIQKGLETVLACRQPTFGTLRVVPQAARALPTGSGDSPAGRQASLPNLTQNFSFSPFTMITLPIPVLGIKKLGFQCLKKNSPPMGRYFADCPAALQESPYRQLSSMASQKALI